MFLVPVAVLGLLWVLVAAHRHLCGLDAISTRGALLVAFLLFEALVVLVTESASVGHHFTVLSVTIAWTGLLCMLVVVAIPQIGQLHILDAHRAPAFGISGRLRALGAEKLVWLTVIVAVFGVHVATGWLYRPSNGDSMVYHLARVEHWIQDRSVAHFATHYLAQIELSPLHEFNMAHLHLLSGGDSLDGYVQVLAMLVCVVGASELARLLHGSPSVQMAAAVLCLTIPSAILEASSTQNNIFAAAIGVALLTIVLAWTGDGWPARAALLGLGTGLAMLAKGTLPVLIGPAVLILATFAVRNELRRTDKKRALLRILVASAVGAVVAALVTGPFLVRNIVIFGGPAGPVSKSTVSTSLTPPAAAANVLRSTAGDFLIGDGRGGLETDVSRLALGSLGALYSTLGVEPSDQRYALGTNFEAFTTTDYRLKQRVEEYGSNPWHVLLIFATISALAVGILRRSWGLKKEALLASGLGLGYLLFTATARWNVYAVRYQVPLLVAWCPLIAVGMGRLNRAVGRFVLVLLVVACLPQLLDNAERSLLHPTYPFSSNLGPYFPYTGGLGPPSADVAAYESATGLIARSTCTQVALANWVLFEYPLWAGLRDKRWRGRIEDVDVQNASRVLEQPGFRPCAWIREEPPTYVSPDNGNINVQFRELAIAIDPSVLDAVRTEVPGFAGNAAGVRVLPGGGWTLASGGHIGTILSGGGSIYLYSSAPRQVRLLLDEMPGTKDPSLFVRNSALQRLPTRRVGQVIEVTVKLQTGINLVRITTVTTPGQLSSPFHIDKVTASAG